MKASKAKTTKSIAKTVETKAPAAVSPAKRTVKTVAAKAPETSVTIARREITPDLIAQRAYIIWEQQGRPQGNDLANWLLAENQLKKEIHSFTA